MVNDGQLLAEPFANLSGKTATAGERDLLGIAFDPEFDQNGYVYVYHTHTHTGQSGRLVPTTESSASPPIPTTRIKPSPAARSSCCASRP